MKYDTLALGAGCTDPVAIMLLKFINNLRNSSSENGHLPYCTHMIQNNSGNKPDMLKKVDPTQ